MQERYIYKIYTAEEWAERQEQTMILGNAKDEKSGFIHASSFEQVGAIVEKYYAHIDTVILKLDTEKLDNVIWEFNKNAVYPHLYVNEGQALSFPSLAIEEVLQLSAGEQWTVEPELSRCKP